MTRRRTRIGNARAAMNDAIAKGHDLVKAWANAQLWLTGEHPDDWKSVEGHAMGKVAPV
jgi:hypothetical protein